VCVCLCVPVQVLNKLTDFHIIWYENMLLEATKTSHFLLFYNE